LAEKFEIDRKQRMIVGPKAVNYSLQRRCHSCTPIKMPCLIILRVWTYYSKTTYHQQMRIIFITTSHTVCLWRMMTRCIATGK